MFLHWTPHRAGIPFMTKTRLWLGCTESRAAVGRLNHNIAVQPRQQKAYKSKPVVVLELQQTAVKPEYVCVRLKSRGRPVLILTTSDSSLCSGVCHKASHSCFLDTCPPRRVADLVHSDPSPAKQKYHLNPEKTNRRNTHCLIKHILHADTNVRQRQQREY